MKTNNFRGASWDSLFLSFVKIVTTLSTMIQTKLLATGLSLEEYGSYSQANMVVSIGTSLIMLGLGDAINYFYNSSDMALNHSNKNKIINTIFLIEIFAGLSFAFAVVLFRRNIANYFSNYFLGALLIVAAFKPVLDNLLYFYQVLYVSTGRAKTIAVRNLIITLLRIIAIYICVNMMNSVAYIFVTLILLDLLQLIFFKLNFAANDFTICPFNVSVSYIKQILTYSLPMGMFAITNMLSREIDKLVVGRLTDTETLAIYANCSKILPFDIIVVSFATVLIPYIMRYISSGEKSKAAMIFSNYMKIGYYSVWILGVAVLITSNQVITMLYTETYVQGNTVFIIYVLDSMLKFASMHLILTAGGKSKQIMLYSLATMLLNLILNIALYFAFGIVGPALATLFTTGLYTYFILRSSVKLIGVKWKDVIDFKDMASFSATLMASGIAFYVLNQVLLNVSVNQYVAMLISAGGFCILNLFVNLKRIMKTLQSVNELRM